MTQNPTLKRIEDYAINPGVRKASRKPAGFRFFVWGIVVVCALAMGLILVSNPTVQSQIAALTTAQNPEAELETAPPVATSPTPLAENTEFGEGDALLAPVRAASAFGALTRSARKAIGLGSPTDHVSVPDVEVEYVFPDGASEAPAASENAAPDRTRPVVSAMPQNRVPVRRAGTVSDQ